MVDIDPSDLRLCKMLRWCTLVSNRSGNCSCCVLFSPGGHSLHSPSPSQPCSLPTQPLSCSTPTRSCSPYAALPPCTPRPRHSGRLPPRSVLQHTRPSPIPSTDASVPLIPPPCTSSPPPLLHPHQSDPLPLSCPPSVPPNTGAPLAPLAPPDLGILVDCPRVPGYSARTRQNSPGNDISCAIAAQPSDGSTKCDNDPNCLAFLFRPPDSTTNAPGLVCTKRALGDPVYMYNVCLYVKAALLVPRAGLGRCGRCGQCGQCGLCGWCAPSTFQVQRSTGYMLRASFAAKVPHLVPLFPFRRPPFPTCSYTPPGTCSDLLPRGSFHAALPHQYRPCAGPCVTPLNGSRGVSSIPSLHPQSHPLCTHSPPSLPPARHMHLVCSRPRHPSQRNHTHQQPLLLGEASPLLLAPNTPTSVPILPPLYFPHTGTCTWFAADRVTPLNVITHTEAGSSPLTSSTPSSPLKCLPRSPLVPHTGTCTWFAADRVTPLNVTTLTSSCDSCQQGCQERSADSSAPLPPFCAFYSWNGSALTNSSSLAACRK